MKIIFYDTKEYEKNFFIEKFENNGEISAKYFENSLLEGTFVDSEYKNYDAISIFVNSYLSKDVLEKFPNLKYIFLRCVGYSNIDLNYCKENNILIYNTPNYGNSTVAEYVFCLLLALSKKLIKVQKDLKEAYVDYEEFKGIELNNKTIGIIGLGAIGTKVATIAKGFNMNVLYYDINKNDEFEFSTLENLYKKSDFISINCLLNDSTRKLINKEAFLLMEKRPIIINVARAEIIDTESLYEALVENKIKGAALDVVECEETLCQLRKKCDMDEHYQKYCLKKFLFLQRFLRMENVIITPHNAYNTIEANKRILDMTYENITFNLSKDTNYSTKNLVLI